MWIVLLNDEWSLKQKALVPLTFLVTNFLFQNLSYRSSPFLLVFVYGNIYIHSGFSSLQEEDQKELLIKISCKKIKKEPTAKEKGTKEKKESSAEQNMLKVRNSFKQALLVCRHCCNNFDKVVCGRNVRDYTLNFYNYSFLINREVEDITKETIFFLETK